MKDNTLYQTPGNLPYMSIKKVSDRNFYYAERLGVDSVAFLLMDVQHDRMGLIREAKPPFNQREELPGNMHFKTTAFGGSLFDHPQANHYLQMTYNQQLKLATDIVIQETKEEAGYQVREDNILFSKRTVFDSMSNSYTWLFVVFVNDNFKCEPDPQNEVEAMAEVVWSERYNEDEFFENVECGKVPAIMFGTLNKEDQFNEKMEQFKIKD